MKDCKATCGHRESVRDYLRERMRLEEAAEEASLGYATELAEHLRDNPLPTFRDYLINHRRPEMQRDPAVEAFLRDYDPPPLHSEMVFNRHSHPQPEGYAAEAELISCALATDEGVAALRLVEPREFVADPRLGNVARAILDSAKRGPHDAATVTNLLRERGQLPVEWDPRSVAEPTRGPGSDGRISAAYPHGPMRTVDPRGYALGAWESTAPPATAAEPAAALVRRHFDQHALRRICEVTLDRLNGTIEETRTGWDDTVAHTTPLVNQLSSWSEQVPPELDRTGREVTTPLSYRGVDVPSAWGTDGEGVMHQLPRRSPADLRMPRPPAHMQRRMTRARG
jgi:hypothetical protein